MHLTVGVFGDKEFVKKLGKQGTVNDIMIYNHADSEGVFTYVSPNSAEGKIQPLLQMLSMIDVPVIVSNNITKELAEQIIAIDAFGFTKGFIVSDSEDLKGIIKGTLLDKFEWVDEKELKEKLKMAEPCFSDNVWVPVDNYFNVKSVGTVILSIIKGGSLKKYDKLMMQPLGKEVIVKGIQSQDKDIEEAQKGMRIGLSLKGVDADEIKRGYVICKECTVSKNIKINFTKNKYSKEAMDNGNQVFLSVGLQVIPGKVEDSTTIFLEHPVAYLPGQKCIIASTKQTMPRIIGTGIIL